MRQPCHDIGELVGVVWVSGTPSLQVPYLINLALLLSSVVDAMPPTPRSLFRLINKLDLAFASLLQGRDVETGQVLPGFGWRRGVSGTEKVRIRSLVERMRVGVVGAFKLGGFEYEYEEEEEEVGDDGDGDGDAMDMDMDMDGELVLEGDDHALDVDGEEDEDSWDMQLARVYDRTVVELGGSLEEPSIGIITEGRG